MENINLLIIGNKVIKSFIRELDQNKVKYKILYEKFGSIKILLYNSPKAYTAFQLLRERYPQNYKQI